MIMQDRQVQSHNVVDPRDSVLSIAEYTRPAKNTAAVRLLVSHA